MNCFFLDSRNSESQFLAISTHRSLDKVMGFFLRITGSLVGNIRKRIQGSMGERKRELGERKEGRKARR